MAEAGDVIVPVRAGGALAAAFGHSKPCRRRGQPHPGGADLLQGTAVAWHELVTTALCTNPAFIPASETETHHA